MLQWQQILFGSESDPVATFFGEEESDLVATTTTSFVFICILSLCVIYVVSSGVSHVASDIAKCAVKKLKAQARHSSFTAYDGGSKPSLCDPVF